MIPQIIYLTRLNSFDKVGTLCMLVHAGILIYIVEAASECNVNSNFPSAKIMYEVFFQNDENIKI